MIYEFSFADRKFESAQKFNAMMAKKRGADRVIKYGEKDIDASFIEDNFDIWNNERGHGYWIWKPYLTQKTLKEMKDGDYLLYMDSGSCLIDNVQILTDIMDKDHIDIMVFSLHSIEKYFSKRDAFILLDCDKPEYTETTQRCATYYLIRKNEYSQEFVSEWLRYSTDRRIITNDENVLGEKNYEGFVENRHDQTILSLLSKKWGIKPYRDPGKYGLDMKYSNDILNRSPYGQVFDDHRYKIMPKTYFTYKYIPRFFFEKVNRIFGHR